MMRFVPHNLLAGMAGLSRFDLIFCRNVLIYLDRKQTRGAEPERSGAVGKK